MIKLFLKEKKSSWFFLVETRISLESFERRAEVIRKKIEIDTRVIFLVKQ